MMSTLKPIRTDEDLEAALARIEEIFDAGEGTPEDNELGVLMDLVELYESKTVEIGYPTPIAAIEFRMDQAGLKPRDLIPLIGSRAKVSEVLAGKRAITMSMARALHEHLGIPADILLQKPGASLDSSAEDIDWSRFPLSRFPLKEMAKRGWIPNVPDLADHAEELLGGLLDRAGGQNMAAAALYRKNDNRRLNAKADPYALTAWCWRVLASANAHRLAAAYEPGTVTPGFLRTIAQLSSSEGGPRHAKEFLAEHGIALEVEGHLPRTHLDGAALWSGDGRPVVGLTLRYDRIDHFWFSLLHEIAHVGLHLDKDSGDWFVDDLSLRDREGVQNDPKEAEADAWAEEALIPEAAWEKSGVREGPTAMVIIDLAYELGIHPAIVAGRVRHESGNYRLLSQFVGTRQVRRQFE